MDVDDLDDESMICEPADTDSVRVSAPTRAAALLSVLQKIDDDGLRLIWGVQLGGLLGEGADQYYWSALKLKRALEDPDKLSAIESVLPAQDIEEDLSIDDVLRVCEQFPRSIKLVNGKSYHTNQRPKMDLNTSSWDRPTDMLYPDREHRPVTRRPAVKAVSRHNKVGIPSRTLKATKAVEPAVNRGFAVVIHPVVKPRPSGRD